jgi:hypothetical protein
MKNKLLRVIFIFIFSGFSNSALGADITGYGKLNWGDSINTIKSKIEGNLKLTTNPRNGAKLLEGKKKILDKVFDSSYAFQNEELSEVTFSLNPKKGGYLTEQEAKAFFNGFKNKYGKLYKNESDNSGTAYIWNLKSGSLTFFYQRSWSGQLTPVFIIYQRTKQINTDQL